jgi:probable dihydroxyacetone kinase regulator
MPKNNKLECSALTQKKLALSLKDLMNTETFEKISVNDITKNCGLHRQTFYYHFVDKYELLDWIVYNELIEPLVDDFNFDNMYIKLNNMFTTMLNDKKFYQNALKINPHDLSRYVSKVASEQLSGAIKHINESTGITSVEKNEVIFAEFFGYGISGFISVWAENGMKESPSTMTKRIEDIVTVCKRLAAERYLGKI